MEITTAISLIAAILFAIAWPICILVGLITVIKAICKLAGGGTRKEDAQSIAQPARIDRA